MRPSQQVTANEILQQQSSARRVGGHPGCSAELVGLEAASTLTKAGAEARQRVLTPPAALIQHPPTPQPAFPASTARETAQLQRHLCTRRAPEMGISHLEQMRKARFVIL